jgi:protein-arginine kinase activator protein McsA
MDNNNHKNLVNFLKFFIGRPNHLAKYLIENEALSDKFLKKLDMSENLADSKTNELDVYFIDINQMNTFFSSLIKKNNKRENLEDLKTELNRELNVCIREERYEDAIRIRDYLKKISKDIH